jgi:UDP-N-acetylglucosamine 2-epimerase (non-hydrolysing)
MSDTWYKIALIVGTRPDIIKMSPIIKEAIKRKTKFILIHSGQHYSRNMDKVFFEQLNIPEPDFRVKLTDVIDERPRKNIKDMQLEFESFFTKEKVTDVITYGDTNTTIASAFAAKSTKCRLYHVEAGLRSGNIEMVEELNRIIVDRMSDILFAPTMQCVDNLKKENVYTDNIVLSGNTISDVVKEHIFSNKEVLEREDQDILLTLHRPELVDNRNLFDKVLNSIGKVANSHNLNIKFVTHPRIGQIVKNGKYNNYGSIEYISALGYREFLKLVRSSKIVLTDSGGLQEEACILNVPCITVRGDTERPESIVCGANFLCDPSSDNFEIDLANLFNNLENSNNTWKSPYGNGESAQIILDHVEKFINGNIYEKRTNKRYYKG